MSQPAAGAAPPAPERPPLWRDERVIKIAAQVGFALVIVLIVLFMASNLINALARLGRLPSLRFLTQNTGFAIGEAPIAYDRTSPFYVAFIVGLLNTLRVSVLSILLATVLGVFVGLGRLSSNFLVSRLSTAYVEIFRNLPLLVLLVFLKIGVFNNLPLLANAMVLPGPVFISNRGIAFPWYEPTASWPAFTGALALALVVAVIVAIVLNHRARATGRPQLVTFWAPVTFLAIGVVAWLVLRPTVPTLPQVGRFNVVGGLTLSPEFLAMWLGLSVFTSAFIAEAVRAGIQAVAHGQVEAARAVGLTAFQSMQMVVFPQGLRVMIPPAINQYLNLIKNSSLAAAVGYPELFNISGTILNQTGRDLEVITLMMVIYLVMSVLTSLLLNWYNAKVRLVER